jgi:hypothetical protein
VVLLGAALTAVAGGDRAVGVARLGGVDRVATHGGVAGRAGPHTGGVGSPERETVMAVTADLAKLLDKAYENTNLPELIDAPVSALSGISEGDGKLLKEAFDISTVGDLGRNKFFRAATALVDLANSVK